jgi:protein-tyrosine kinase
VNASVEMWRNIHSETSVSGEEVAELSSASPAINVASSSQGWNASTFADTQIAALVRRVFLSGWSSPAKQVVFTAVDADHDISSICFKVASLLAAQVSDKVCLVDADIHSGRLQARMRELLERAPGSLNRELVREEVVAGSHNLRFMPASDLVPTRDNSFSASWLRHRFAELRREFEYVIFHAPPAGISSETGLISHLIDGVVLVLHAGRTRRAVALHAQGLLQAAQARVIGTVLDRRRFPVPAILYRRL